MEAAVIAGLIVALAIGVPAAVLLIGIIRILGGKR